MGVFHFKQDSSSISTTVYPDSLQVSPVGDRSFVVVVSFDKRFLYVSRDFGKTWSRYETPTTRFDPAEELYLSNHNPQHMVIHSVDNQVSSTYMYRCNVCKSIHSLAQLYVTYNAGIKWKFVSRNVQMVEL